MLYEVITALRQSGLDAQAGQDPAVEDVPAGNETDDSE